MCWVGGRVKSGECTVYLISWEAETERPNEVTRVPLKDGEARSRKLLEDCRVVEGHG